MRESINLPPWGMLSVGCSGMLTVWCSPNIPQRGPAAGGSRSPRHREVTGARGVSLSGANKWCPGQKPEWGKCRRRREEGGGSSDQACWELGGEEMEEEAPSEAGREQVGVLSSDKGSASSVDAVEELRWKKKVTGFGNVGLRVALRDSGRADGSEAGTRRKEGRPL